MTNIIALQAVLRPNPRQAIVAHWCIMWVEATASPHTQKKLPHRKRNGMADMNEAIEQALAMKHVAIVGLSNKPDRPSNHVGAYLAAHGYQIVPVNPTEDEVLGLKAYPSVTDIPADIPVEVVDIFRKGEDTPPIVEQAIARGAKAVWLQLGITSEESKRLAEQAGLPYVEDHCMRLEHIERHPEH
jgi:uncharacterized protein